MSSTFDQKHVNDSDDHWLLQCTKTDRSDSTATDRTPHPASGEEDDSAQIRYAGGHGGLRVPHVGSVDAPVACLDEAKEPEREEAGSGDGE